MSNQAAADLIGIGSGLLGMFIYKTFGWVPGFANTIVASIKPVLAFIGLTQDDFHMMAMAGICAAIGWMVKRLLDLIFSKPKKEKKTNFYDI